MLSVPLLQRPVKIDFSSSGVRSTDKPSGLSAVSKNARNSASSMVPLLSASKLTKSSSAESCFASQLWRSTCNAAPRASPVLAAVLLAIWRSNVARRLVARVRRLSICPRRSSCFFTSGVRNALSSFFKSSSRLSSMGRSSPRAAAMAPLAASSASAAACPTALISASDSFPTPLAKGSTAFSASLIAASTPFTRSGLAAAAFAFSSSCGFRSRRNSTFRDLFASLR
mmetsp:Transcript_39868/g.113863  ORF Transcript_39868/g.113863 Transcript_39868/m.113863 type:complete len:227 (-) Transcript_39868:1038-1718(-)